jgi:hypothetical protein
MCRFTFATGHCIPNEKDFPFYNMLRLNAGRQHVGATESADPHQEKCERY